MSTGGFRPCGRTRRKRLNLCPQPTCRDRRCWRQCRGRLLQPRSRMRDDLDAGGHAHRGYKPLRPVLRSFPCTNLVEDIDRTRGQGVVGLEDLASIGGGGHDQDGRGGIGHDLLGGDQAARARQNHVHRHHIRAQLAAQLDSPLPVPRLTGNDDAVPLQHADQVAANGEGIFDDQRAQRTSRSGVQAAPPATLDGGMEDFIRRMRRIRSR
jgi:hypothetical protein